MGKVLFEDANIQFYKEDKHSIFNCSHCGQMGNEAPVRSKTKQGKLSTYHEECAQAVIYRINHSSKLFEEQVLNIPKPNFPKVSEKPKSYLKPVEDEELERKKAKLKAILHGDRVEAVLPEVAIEKEKVVAKPKAKIEMQESGNISITHKYDQNLVDKYHFIKEIKWNSGFKYWECNIKNADYETCRFFFKIHKEIPRFDWLISDEAFKAVKARIDWHENQLRKNKEIKELKEKKDINLDLSFMKMEPYPYQKVGIAFLNKIHGVGMVGDSMGLGKTLQAIGYTAQNNLRTVIVCPASLKYNWKNEIAKFTNKTAVVLTEYQAEELSPKNALADYIIINYEQLEKYSKYLLKSKFDCVILDESQYIMNLQAKRTKLVFKLFKKVEKRMCLSGTPIKNRPIEFYSQLKFLRPDQFSNKMKYALRYCDAKETPFGWDMKGASNLDELNRKIAPFYIRRLKQEVLKELPPKTVTVIETDLNVTEKNEYLKIKRDFERFMKDNWSVHGVGYQDQRLDGAHLAKLMELKMFCSQTKVARVIEFVKEFVEASENRKIIVFSQFIHTQKMLRDAFPGISVSLLGEDAAEKRQEAVERFQNDPKIRVFVGSTIAAGVGLTLTAADTVIFADLMWSPADHQQAEDRAHRISQENPVFVYYMIFKETIEEMIWKVIGRKLSVIEQTLDGKNIQGSNPDVAKTVFSQMLKEFKDKKDADKKS